MYNQFVADISKDLNETFAYFKTEGITELIVDLRYNGGGSVQNCVELASMITGQYDSEIFAEEIWNQKLLTYLEERFGRESLINRFVNKLGNEEQINSLKFNRVYIITSSESASASELLINGLTSYIDVIQVGEKTFGKNVGSITVYDYIDNEKTKIVGVNAYVEDDEPEPVLQDIDQASVHKQIEGVKAVKKNRDNDTVNTKLSKSETMLLAIRPFGRRSQREHQKAFETLQFFHTAFIGQL